MKISRRVFFSFCTLSFGLCISMVSAAKATAPVPAAYPASRYEKMAQKSPFAPATPAAAPTPATAPFVENLYVTGVAKIGEKDFVTIQSRDGNTHFSLATGESAPDGTMLVKVDWAGEVGKSKVTLKKGNETGQVSFDQAAAAAAATAQGGAVQPQPGANQPPRVSAVPAVPRPPGTAPQIRPLQQPIPQPQAPGMPNPGVVARPVQPGGAAPSPQAGQNNPQTAQPAQPDLRKRTRIILNRPQ